MGAALLELLGEIVERCLVDAGYRGLGGEVDFGDSEAGVGFVESDDCGGFEGLGRVLGGGELAGERHGEAAGVGHGDELLGVGADAVFKTGAEAVLGVLRVPLWVEIVPFCGVFQSAVPNCACAAIHDDFSLRFGDCSRIR